MQPDHPAFRTFSQTLAQAAHPLVPDERALARLAEQCTLRRLDRNDHALRIGDVMEHVLFVVRGLMRYYFLDPETGTERTGQFFDEGRVFSDVESLFGRIPARQAIQALEETELLFLPIQALQAAYDADHAIERYGRLLVQEALIGSQRRAARLLTLAPDELYRAFVTTRPEVARRVPQYMIASYLGITPEGLSRIRRRAVRRPAQRP